MSLKERLDKKKKKYLQKLAGKEDKSGKRITGASDDGEAPAGSLNAAGRDRQPPANKEKREKLEKEVWKYEGETNEDGEYHGVGRLYNTQTIEFFEGQWRVGKREGFGTQQFATGERYQGAWKGGLMEGMGVITFPSKDSFTGLWHLGQRVSGTWTFNANEGSAVFTQSWVDGAPGPVGQLIFSTGGKYTGEVSHALVGKYTIKNFQIFRSGYGEMEWGDDTRYIGGWKKDKRKGFGVLIDSTGETYYGEWQRGKRSGFGLQMYTDGTYYEGQHLHDEMKGKGKMCVPSGDLIVGEWENSRVSSAQFFKGEFQTVPRPVRNIFMNTVNQIQKTEEKAPFITSQKWTSLISDLLFDRASLNYNVVLKQVKAHSHQEIDQTSITARMGLDPDQPPIIRLLNRFIYLFVWEYEAAATNVAPNKKITYLLQSAVDDVNSFLACMTQKIAELIKLEYEQTKKLYERLMQAIFAKIYPIIFPLYTEELAVEDALAEAKRSELSSISTKTIGVKAKYLLESEDSESGSVNRTSRSASVATPPTKGKTGGSPGSITVTGTKPKVIPMASLDSEDESAATEEKSSKDTATAGKKEAKLTVTPAAPPSAAIDPTTGLPVARKRQFPGPRRASSKRHSKRFSAVPKFDKEKEREKEKEKKEKEKEKETDKEKKEEGKENETEKSEKKESETEASAAAPLAGTESEGGPTDPAAARLLASTKKNRRRSKYRRSTSSAHLQETIVAALGSKDGEVPKEKNTSPDKGELLALSDQKNLSAAELEMMKNYVANEVNKEQEKKNKRRHSDRPPSKAVVDPSDLDAQLALEASGNSNIRVFGVDESEASESEVSFLKTVDLDDPRRNMPYYDVIRALDGIEICESPIDKLRCLSKASQAVLDTVDAFFKDKSKNILMGAEDKFPVLIYALIHSKTTQLYSHARFLSDFVNRHVGDMDREFLVSNLMDALKYIRSLEWQVRDASSVLIPVKLLLSNISWAAKGLPRLKIPPELTQLKTAQEVRGQIIVCLNTIFRGLGSRSADPYSPFPILPEFNPLFRYLTTSFFERALGKEVGLKVVEVPASQGESGESGAGDSDALEAEGEEGEAASGYQLEFVLQHPLYIYSRLAEVAIAPGSVD